ncbi:MAG: hypothetical protein LBS74_09395, partial [Oscillospiraceae bacterium]|nr:hypothetical protein [Oscillospiraceae bacterium]
MFNNDIIFIKSFNSKKFLAGCAENIVYLYELENDKFKLLHKFKTLKHPAHIAFSSDDNLIAIKNTSGNTVVHKLDNGELLIRHKTSKREGGNLYFIENDRKLISSDWDGNIFTVDIYSGEYNYIKIENGRVGNLF